MKPPRTLHLGAEDYDVREKKNLDLLGETQAPDSRILIKKGQSASCKRNTVMHELLHAVIFLSGYGRETKHAKEERLVVTLAPWILAALRDNPDLVDYLLEA